MDDEEATSSSLTAYYDLLQDNRAFTVVWLGEVCPAAVCGAASRDTAWNNGTTIRLFFYSDGACR